jgi:tetratricopeptide (TPR) repeat protein
MYSKSSAAREYARQYETRFPNAAVLVVNAETYSSFQRDLREIGIPSSGNNYPSAGDIHDELSSRSIARWLMVVENANDWDLLFGPNSILQHIPTSSNGSVLFITRDKYVARGLVSKTNIEILDGLDQSEAEELLLSGIGIPKPASEDAASMDELLEILGYQPCLICCAASFISANSISIRTYVQEYCKDQNSTTEHLCSTQDFIQPQLPTSGSGSNLASWYDDLIGLFENIRRNEPHAADLLRFMACLAIERIPKALLSSKPLPTLEIDISKALRVLTRYCLITGDEDYQLFGVPLMVRLAARRWLKEHRSLDIWVNAAFCSVYQRFPEVNSEKETLELCNAYFVHAEEVLRLREPPRERLDNEATLAIRCSEYLRMKGHFSRAVEFATEANTWSKNRFGATGEKTLACLGKLAALLRDQGIYIKAREIDERILDQRIRVQGQRHPATMAAMNGLASAFHGLGWYKKAAKMHNYVFRLRKSVLGPGNPETLASMANLCRSLASLEILDPAEKIAKKVVLIKSELYGPEHPSTILSMQTLGSIFRRRGKYSEAEHLFKIVLKTRKDTQRDDMHPEVLLAMGNMVGALEDRGKFQEAKTLAEEVLSASTKKLGPKHPNTIKHANNLSEILIHLKDFDKAEKLKRQVLRDRKEILGCSHPDTLYAEDGLKYLLGMKYPEWQRSPMILLLAA